MVTLEELVSRRGHEGDLQGAGNDLTLFFGSLLHECLNFTQIHSDTYLHVHVSVSILYFNKSLLKKTSRIVSWKITWGKIIQVKHREVK